MTVTATYTTVYDWQPGDTITQARINAMQSNIMALKTPPQQRLVKQVTTSTTSASFADIALATLTVTPTIAEAYIVWFVGSFNISTATTAVITLVTDGVNEGDATQGLQHVPATAATNCGIALPFKTSVLSVGSHILKVQWKTAAGTLTLLAGWHMFAQAL